MLWILTVAFICVVGLYIYGLYLQGAEHTKNLNYQETVRRKYAGKENLNIADYIYDYDEKSGPVFPEPLWDSYSSILRISAPSSESFRIRCS